MTHITKKLENGNKMNLFIKGVFNDDEKKLAEFAAYLTDSIVDFDENKKQYMIIEKEKINELIKKAYEDKDYIKANDLLKSAEKSAEKSETSAVISKSIRVKGGFYLRLLNESDTNNISIANSFKKLLIPKIKEILDSLKNSEKVNKKKLEQLIRVFEVWKNSTSPKLDHMQGESLEEWEVKIDENLKNFCKLILTKECENIGLTERDIGIILRNLEWEDITTYINIFIKKSDKKDKRSIIEIGHNLPLFIKDYEILKEEIGFDVYNKFKESFNLEEEAFSGEFPTGPFTISTLYSEYITIKNNIATISDVPLLTENKEKIKKLIANDFYSRLKIKKDDEEKLQFLAQKALKKGNIKLAKEYNEELTNHQSIDRITDRFTGFILEIVKHSNVITFTIPKVLLNLIESCDKFILKQITEQ